MASNDYEYGSFCHSVACGIGRDNKVTGLGL
jgi:hypothetical protein